MKIKNIVTLLIVEFLLLQEKINGVVFAAGGDMANNKCYAVANECSRLSFFVTTALLIFLMLILWAVSPVGILFFLALRMLSSKKSSVLKRKIAWIIQGIAFAIWTSLMTVMLIIYFDSISYNILNFGSAILDFAIMSGFAFLFIMLAVCFMEKRMIKNNKNAEMKKDNGKNNAGRNKKVNNDNKKIVSIKKNTTIKGRVKQKLKEDLKEIVNDEIDKRL